MVQETKKRETVCRIKGCEKSVKSSELCSLHYGRMRRAELAAQDCSIEGCDKPMYQKGICQAHYERMRKYGDPLAGPPPTKKYTPRDRCSWEECTELATVAGMCSTHYQRARYQARYEHLIPEENRAPRCILPGCEEPQASKGLCRKHRTQQLRGNDVFEEVTEDMDYSAFGKRVYLARVRLGLTLGEAGGRMGVTRERVRQIEKKTNPPYPPQIKRIAEALEVDPVQLIGESIEGVAAGTNGEEKQTVVNIAKSKVSLETPCPWCSGTGELKINDGWTTVCAYCRGYKRVAIVPIEPDEQKKE